VLLTHGDTFTAWIAALMGKRAGCVVGHIESGCRSYNILSPFPEELSRLLTFQLSDIYFCADDWAVRNLRRYKGLKVNMGANTMLDGVRFALSHPSAAHFEFESSPYAVVSIHRFENIFTKRLADTIIPILRDIARNRRLIFTLHPTTRERLLALGLHDELASNRNITLHERFNFVDWIRICSSAEFVITDGGSNQEELSYLGVPTLLFRRETERHEGLGENVVISGFDRTVIDEFVRQPELHRRTPSFSDAKPSETIIEVVARAQVGVPPPGGTLNGVKRPRKVRTGGTEPQKAGDEGN
jgi:UDP-N-acetylglucosamine 2-epimerase (non-hydrolysing)